MSLFLINKPRDKIVHLDCKEVFCLFCVYYCEELLLSCLHIMIVFTWSKNFQTNHKSQWLVVKCNFITFIIIE